ncbi:MAG: hypothetical protein R2839_10870 [Thermomicrobiales bacterium]
MKLSFASLVGLDPLPIQGVIAWAADHDVDGLEVNTGQAFPVIGDNHYAGHLDLEAVLADGPSPRSRCLPTGASVFRPGADD